MTGSQILLVSKIMCFFSPAPLIKYMLPGYYVALQKTRCELLSCKRFGFERRN